MSHAVVLDGGWRSTRHAESALHDLVARLGVPVHTACTHFVTDPGRVVVRADLDTEPPPGFGPVARSSVQDAVRAATGGRAFVFHGWDVHPGRVSAGDLVATTAIDEVLTLGGEPAGRSTIIDTQGFLRPEFDGTRLVLTTRPAAGALLVPFEQPNPTPCCADHV